MSIGVLPACMAHTTCVPDTPRDPEGAGFPRTGVVTGGCESSCGCCRELNSGPLQEQ